MSDKSDKRDRHHIDQDISMEGGAYFLPDFQQIQEKRNKTVSESEVEKEVAPPTESTQAAVVDSEEKNTPLEADKSEEMKRNQSVLPCANECQVIPIKDTIAPVNEPASNKKSESNEELDKAVYYDFNDKKSE